jgi:hypothetical protein
VTTEPKKDGTPEERRAYRLTRLPILAQEELAARDHRIAQLERELSKALGQGEPDPRAARVGDYIGELTGRQLPCRLVRFGGEQGVKSFLVEIDEDGKLIVHSDQKMVLHMRVSNEVLIQQGWEL